ncbi:MAG TPA: hypothetical protein VFX98_09785 [Longimicrobiaceae bacterium]|nr:hypothetical protein [Longimicrobiaceae bacterium]
MVRVRLNPDELEVSSFDPIAPVEQPSFSVTYDAKCCCTGCDSGCGINPTAGGCVSADETYFAC